MRVVELLTGCLDTINGFQKITLQAMSAWFQPKILKAAVEDHVIGTELTTTPTVLHPQRPMQDSDSGTGTRLKLSSLVISVREVRRD